jgi:predicted secreted protein
MFLSLLKTDLSLSSREATAERPMQAAASRPVAARAAIAYTEMLGARKKVHYVEDSMRVCSHI